jgi:hypothetical protein
LNRKGAVETEYSRWNAPIQIISGKNEGKNPRTRPRRARDDILSASGEELTRVLAYLGAICTSFSLSVIFIPGCSRRNRISEDGSVEEYTPLT